MPSIIGIILSWGDKVSLSVARNQPTPSLPPALQRLSSCICRNERVRYLFATVEWADENEKCAASNDETEGPSAGVAFFIWSEWLAYILEKWEKHIPRITSSTSSKTRFMSASYPFKVPVTNCRQSVSVCTSEFLSA